jgi:hypothetical protein
LATNKNRKRNNPLHRLQPVYLFKNGLILLERTIGILPTDRHPNRYSDALRRGVPMQKLNAVINLKGCSGSALVGTVVLSVILLIAGAGYIGITASIANHEIESLNDMKARYAAESGIYLACAYLIKNSGPGSTPEPFFVNGMKVQWKIILAPTNTYELRSYTEPPSTPGKARQEINCKAKFDGTNWFFYDWLERSEVTVP